MLNVFVVAIALLSIPRATILDVEQTQHLLDVSVIIRAKEYHINPKTKEIKRGVVGCSGTYISETTILTAAHCFEYPHTDIWVRGSDKISRNAVLLKKDKKKDLAILSLKKGSVDHFAELSQDVRIGEAVYNVGSPFSLEFLISEGIVAQTGKKVPDFTSSFIVTTAMINSGSSGGGAFNENGELIGVNTLTVGGFFGWAGISMAVDRDTIEDFLKDR